MARINKAKNFAGKSYVVSNEIESLIQSMSFEDNVLKFGANAIGDDTVSLGNGVDFTTWINAAKDAAKSAAVTAVIGQDGDAASANTVYGAKADATAKSDKALADAKAYADGKVSAAATEAATDAKDKADKALADAKAYADRIAAVAINVEAGDGIKISVAEESTTNVISTDIKLVSATAAEGATATYELQVKEAGKDTYKSVGSIDIPKDMVATKGELVDRKEGETEATGTYIKMTVANGEAFYINVADLIEYNSYANSDTISFALVEGQAHQYKFNIVDGSITTAKIADANVTAAKLSEDAKALFDAAGAADQALADAKAYTDSEIDKLDGDATIATVNDGVVTIKGGIVEVDGVVDNSEASDIVLAKVATTGAAADISVADTENVIDATTVEGALVEVAKEINAVATAVNKTAVQFVSASLTLGTETTLGTVDGRVIAVYGKDGDQVYPEITFADNRSTIKVEGLTADEAFTVIYATTITIA